MQPTAGASAGASAGANASANTEAASNAADDAKNTASNEASAVQDTATTTRHGANSHLRNASMRAHSAERATTAALNNAQLGASAAAQSPYGETSTSTSTRKRGSNLSNTSNSSTDANPSNLVEERNVPDTSAKAKVKGSENSQMEPTPK
jgi:hypothetical protein